MLGAFNSRSTRFKDTNFSGRTIAERPELTGTIIILVAIPETMVILGFVVATMILNM
jgi:V/A-type H+-transporting ATPase subunit K